MGKAFPPQLCPLCGERRRGWRAEAGLTLSSPGRCEQAGAAAAGAGGQDYLMEEGMMGSRMKGILLTRGQPSIQRQAVGNPAKEDLVVLQFSTFLLLGVEYKCIYFFLMAQFEINRKTRPPLQTHPINLNVQGRLTFIKKKLGELNAILLQIFKGKTQS